MKQILLLVFSAASMFIDCESCNSNADAGAGNNNNVNPTGSKMIVRIGTSTFKAVLYDNATASAFKSLLPLTIEMAELNGNEKFADLSRRLPANASNPGTIQAGDLMLYGSGTLVLFYQTFSTSYSYTRVGRIDDVTGLANAVGSGTVTVAFELE
jgi:hypothetical protein